MFDSNNEVEWSDIKNFLDSRNVPAQYVDFKETYWILGTNGPFEVWCRIAKTDPASEDQTDFETNYLSAANTTLTDNNGHMIVRSAAFSDSEGFRARFKGFKGTALKNDTQDPSKATQIDFLIPEERFINGVRLMLSNHQSDDSMDFLVVDKDYIYAGVLYPADYQGIPWSTVAPNGVELDKFGENWYVDATQDAQLDVMTPYPAKILAGLYIRMKYYATGTVKDVTVRANLYLHKKV